MNYPSLDSCELISLGRQPWSVDFATVPVMFDTNGAVRASGPAMGLPLVTPSMKLRRRISRKMMRGEKNGVALVRFLHLSCSH